MFFSCYTCSGDNMYEYIFGVIKDVESDYIVLDNNGIGYMIYTSNPYSFKIGEEVKMYIYQQIREDENSLYGFKTKEDKLLFLKLINVKGLGCKMAMPMLATGNRQDIVSAIEEENVNYLKKFPKIGDKVARQIILDLKGKLTSNSDNNIVLNEELVDALKALGYKTADIKKVVPNVKSGKLENQIKEALKLMLR